MNNQPVFNCDFSFLCITPCSEQNIIQIIMLLIEQNIGAWEIFFVDTGTVERHEFFSSLGSDQSFLERIHYLYAPECLTHEEKVKLISDRARGDIWHFITPDTLYPPKYFQKALAKANNNIQGSTSKLVYIQTLDDLRCVPSRASHFSHLATLCFHRRDYESQGIWFNTQGDEASIGQFFEPLKSSQHPVSIVDNLMQATENGIIRRSSSLPITDSPVALPVITAAVLPTLINWDFFDKIVYIAVNNRADDEQKLLATLKQLSIPESKIVRSVSKDNNVLAHISVLQQAIDKQWRNVLILDDDILFVKHASTGKQLNHFINILKNVEWDVAMLSADYQHVSTFTHVEGVVKINKASSTGAYSVNKNYYHVLINHYEQAHLHLEKIKAGTEYPTDNYWENLMLHDRWLGIWPCFFFKKNKPCDSNKVSADRNSLFFKPLLSINLDVRNKLEEQYMTKYRLGESTFEDHIKLEQLYRCEGMVEIADYFHHLSAQQPSQHSANENWPLLSAIIPTYNQVAMLSRTLDSVLRQRYPNMEILVVDDCSTDGTCEYLSSINDPRLRVVRNKKNMRSVGCHLQGFNNTHGEYVFFIDHDDLLLDRDYLMDAVMRLEQDKSLAFVFSRHVEWREQENKFISNYKGINSNKVDGKHYFANFRVDGYPTVTYLTSVFRRSAAQQTDAIALTGVGDVQLFLCMMLVGNVGFINATPSAYRIHNKSITFNVNNIEFDRLFMQQLEETLEKARKYGLSASRLEGWLTRVARIHFTFWRLPVLLQGKNYELTLALLSWLYQRYPEIAIQSLAKLPIDTRIWH